VRFVFLGEELAPSDVDADVVGRHLIRLTEVSVGLLELAEGAFGFGDTNEVGRR
jgi:hypothetical protein